MINIYCDESCHLEHDNSNVMIIGAMSCPDKEKSNIFRDIRNIKEKNGLSSWFEIKWTKVSYTKLEFYKELIDYFFNNNNLNFRAIVACNKKELDHIKYNHGDYNEWYYKMYFTLLNIMINEQNFYKIFIDIKDTHGGPRINKLHKVLCNNVYDFKSEVISGVYQINSKESEILQLADLLIGALGYYHRGLCTGSVNLGKKELIEYIIERYKIDFSKKTNVDCTKFNLFIWYPGWGRK